MSGEREYPDGGENFTTGEQVQELLAANDCKGKVKVEDRGNPTYAWLYLINGSDQNATVTIRRTWIYQGKLRSDTKEHRLYPGEEREVFSFDRVQEPRVTLLACSLN
ncbi:MAG TPA: hypothetical protein VFZ09_19925 [Archangium sp.]|uniref:hypothetical protein n=1 Tax=Archangium sp. TaxID=1872627 RepID=UPI002E315178|nr:hypothetical protein [Archangium sp.]HEX5748518.1 hypothetical protein [Archangium sp.]